MKKRKATRPADSPGIPEMGNPALPSQRCGRFGRSMSVAGEQDW